MSKQYIVVGKYIGDIRFDTKLIDTFVISLWNYIEDVDIWNNFDGQTIELIVDDVKVYLIFNINTHLQVYHTYVSLYNKLSYFEQFNEDITLMNYLLDLVVKNVDYYSILSQKEEYEKESKRIRYTDDRARRKYFSFLQELEDAKVTSPEIVEYVEELYMIEDITCYTLIDK